MWHRVRDWVVGGWELRRHRRRERERLPQLHVEALQKLSRERTLNARLAAERDELLRQLAGLNRVDGDNFNLPGLTAAEIERLALLAEECGEIAQAVGKVLRHGWESASPYGGRTNRIALEREIGNVRAVVNLMLDSRDVRLNEIQSWQRFKRGSLEKWTHHQEFSMPREEQLEMIRAIEANRQ